MRPHAALKKQIKPIKPRGLFKKYKSYLFYAGMFGSFLVSMFFTINANKMQMSRR